jgi:SAM-dependent methyltransferase
MDVELIKSRKQDVVEKYGEWTAHNIHLGNGLYTFGNEVRPNEIRLRRVVQIVADLSRKPIQDLRLLDLACLEGSFAVEFAHRGAEVVAIEGRTANIEKARFAKEVLSLASLNFIQDDVRNLSGERYGHFDIVLCLGILYHLDVPDVFTFLDNLSEVCRGFAIIDTHVSLYPSMSYTYGGNVYWGERHTDRSSEAIPEEWTSMGNPKSFWLTRASLCNFLLRVGFTSTYECLSPEFLEQAPDRITLVTAKGQMQELISSPHMNKQRARDLPEEPVVLMVQPLGRLSSFSRFVPRSAKKLIRKILYY